MKFLIVLFATVACALAQAVLPSGYLADTPEVAAAKASHLSEKAVTAYSDYYNNYYKTLGYAPYSYLPSAYYADYPLRYAYDYPAYYYPYAVSRDAPDVAAVKAIQAATGKRIVY